MVKKYYQKKPDPIKLSAEGLKKAKADVKKYEKIREEILERLQTAREMGDLSENSAYKYAKFELRDCDRKLRQARKLATYGVATEKKAGDKINFGNNVTVRSEKGEMRFTLVSEHESDPVFGKLSENSPIGEAVMGKSVGDTVEVSVPLGKINYEIIDVS